MNTRENRYMEALLSLPPSGGKGCHPKLLSVANYGVYAGFDADRIFDDLREFVDDALREVPDEEILNAIDTACSDAGNRADRQRRQGPRRHQRQKKKKKCLRSKTRELINAGHGATEANFIRASAVPIPAEPQEHTVLMLETLYQRGDIVFIGGIRDAGIPRKTLHQVGQILEYFRRGVKAPAHIIPNPLTGKTAPTRTGNKDTYRGDRCVDQFRFAVVEFDDLTRAEQLAFWAAVQLPVHALIDSGGKSIHGWIAIDGVESLEQWETHIKEALYGEYLIPLGVDGACSNAARLSRLPGHHRDTGRYQRLLYLNPQGGLIQL